MRPIPFSKDCYADTFDERIVTRSAYSEALRIMRDLKQRRSPRAVRTLAIALLEQEIADTRKQMLRPTDQYTVRDCLWYIEPREKAVRALRKTL